MPLSKRLIDVVLPCDCFSLSPSPCGLSLHLTILIPHPFRTHHVLYIHTHWSRFLPDKRPQDPHNHCICSALYRLKREFITMTNDLNRMTGHCWSVVWKRARSHRVNQEREAEKSGLPMMFGSVSVRPYQRPSAHSPSFRIPLARTSSTSGREANSLPILS